MINNYSLNVLANVYLAHQKIMKGKRLLFDVVWIRKSNLLRA
ncbi:hypothetical protein JCM19233_4699 [Vibrio astriarenae]|nr:hypothetical protein JCM19233_4699 [Vibrio sp. C7]